MPLILKLHQLHPQLHQKHLETYQESLTDKFHQLVDLPIDDSD